MPRSIFALAICAALGTACSTQVSSHVIGGAGDASGGKAGSAGSSAGSGGTSGAGAGGAGGGGTGGSSAGTGGASGAGGCAPESPPGTAGPSMIELARSDGSCFWIDSTEVTRADYDAFLATNPSPATQSNLCSFNADFTTTACDGDAGAPPGDHPVDCVDWCDAAAFCVWAGKSLCAGAYGGANLVDPAKSRWFSACSSNGANDYPYGTAFDSNACNGAQRSTTGCATGSCTTVAAGALTGCKTPAGVSDLSGNVAEWVDECDAVIGATDQCYVRGGAVNDSFDALSCKAAFSRSRASASRFVGFRCCRDAGP